MFTGIIQHIGVVRAIDKSPSGVRLAIDASGWSHQPRSGDSIAIDGCCLTLAHEWTPRATDLLFDAVSETLSKTALGDRAVGDRVNLEHSLRADAMLDGHIVQGHVEAVGVIAHVQDHASDWRLRVSTPEALMPCVVPKGSITVDGVSLTIAAITDDAFEVALIPTTLERTTLRDRSLGDRVNLETDVLARTVLHQLRAFTPELLRPRAT